MQARKIPKNYRNLTGQLSSKKSSRPISFESKLERDFFMIFEFDKTITTIYDQPIKIEYLDEKDGKEVLRSYTPDVYLERTNGLPTIIGEVKYINDLRKDWERLKPKFRAALKYAANQKEPTIFRIYTDRHPKIFNRDYIKNIHFLATYRSFNTEHYEIIKDLFYDNITVTELLELYSDDRREQMILVPSVWGLIKNGTIEVDLYTWFVPETKLLSMKEHL